MSPYAGKAQICVSRVTRGDFWVTGQCRLRVKRYMVGAHREPLNVRFAPKATELLRRREMTLWADFVAEVD